MNRIQRTPRAEADLLAIHDYIDTDNPKAADRFLDAAEQTFKQLAAMPGMGRPWESGNPRLAAMRVYPIPHYRNYLVFYFPLRDGVQIVTILHGARDLETVLDDLTS